MSLNKTFPSILTDVYVTFYLRMEFEMDRLKQEPACNL